MITVVVPVYNVENYIKRCIESILSQTYQELEIILVDDGSTDNSGVICDQYSVIDKRVKVIHKENGGLSDARNVGLKAALGEYITFVDSDDYIDQNMYYTILHAMQECEAEIGVCGIEYVDKEKFVPISCLKNKKIYKDKEAIFTYLSSDDLNSSVCNKIFKTSLFKGIYFPLQKKFEDTFIIHKVIEQASVVVHVGKGLYYYVNRSGSITKQSFSIKDMDLLEAKREIYMRYKLDHVLNKYAERNYLESYLIILDKIIYYDSVEEYKFEFIKCLNFIKNNILYYLKNKTISKKNKVKVILIFSVMPFYKKIITRNNIGVNEK